MARPVLAWDRSGDEWGPITWNPSNSGSSVALTYHGSSWVGFSLGTVEGVRDNGGGSYSMIYKVTAHVGTETPVIRVATLSSSNPKAVIGMPEGLWIPTGWTPSTPADDPNTYVEGDADILPAAVYYVTGINPVTGEASTNRAVLSLLGGDEGSYQAASWFTEDNPDTGGGDPDPEPEPEGVFWTRFVRAREIAL